MRRLVFMLLLALAAPAMGQVRFKVLKGVPPELNGFWCLNSQGGEPVTNPWTSGAAKEFLAHRCVVNNKTDPAEIEKLPDLTIDGDYIHLRMDARCHVDRIAKFPGIFHALRVSCVNRSLHNPIFIGSDPQVLWMGRSVTGDLLIMTDVQQSAPF